MNLANSAILGLDQSTSATKAVLFDHRGAARAETTLPHGSSFPQPGWVEQDPDEILRNTLTVAAGTAAHARTHGLELRAVGLTNQRETVVVWDRRTGRPVHPALGWQCLRGQEITARWREAGWEDLVREVTGLPLDPHFSAPKIAWVLESVPGAREAAEAGRLVFGTIDTWLIWNLTAGTVLATDPSNASRTLLYNLRENRWDPRLLEAFGIPASMAPEIRMSDAPFGTTDLGGALPTPLPICGVLGDSHAALFGMKCFAPGQAKATYGTGSSVMLNLGPQLPAIRRSEVVTSAAWGVGGQVSYVLEGNIHHSGDTLKWLIESLGLFGSTEAWETASRSVDDTEGVYLVPAFSGLGAPYWDEGARGALTGLVRGTTGAHVARAALESLAYQVADLLEAMRQASDGALSRLSVDGGPTKNPVLMQFQADLGQVEVSVSAAPNASVYGVALLAGLSAGLWSGFPELAALGGPGQTYRPGMDPSRRDRLWTGWKEAVARVRTGGAR